MTKPQQELVLPVIWLPGLVGVLVISAVMGIVLLLASSVREDRSEEVKVAQAELARRIPVVVDEISRLGTEHPWAGLYYRGDGLGVNIRFWLAPQAGCVATWRGCLGLYGANWGTLTEQDGEIRVAFERPSETGEFGSFPSVFRVERVGEAMRLVLDGEASDSYEVLLRQ